MAHNDVEIEVKFPLKNEKAIIAFLNKNAQQKTTRVVQKDSYFTPPHKNFLSPKFPYEWLRLRESGEETVLNYKHFYPENEKTIDYCDEFETKVDSPVIRKIFANLQFKELVIVEKSRSTWIFKDIEIAIDNVKGLGSFIELEITTPFEDPKKAKEYLYAVIKEIGVETGEEDYRGYPFLLLERKKGSVKKVLRKN